MDITKAKDIVCNVFNSSYYRKTTKVEQKAIRNVTLIHGDDFVQSLYREMATRNLERK